MKKILAIMVFAAIASMMITAPSHGEYESANPDQRVSEGRVVAIDTANSILTVNGVTRIDFPISSDTVLKKYGSDMEASDIKLLDINAGDYVTVEYVRAGPDESRVPYKVTKVTVQSGKASW